MTPILHITSQLVLPENFPVSQCLLVPLFYLVNYLDRKILISTSPLATIVVAQPTILSFDLLFMIGVPLFEGGGAFSHILPPALLTCS